MKKNNSEVIFWELTHNEGSPKFLIIKKIIFGEPLHSSGSCRAGARPSYNIKKLEKLVYKEAIFYRPETIS